METLVLRSPTPQDKINPGYKSLCLTVHNNRKTLFAKWDKVRVTPVSWLMLGTCKDASRNNLTAPHFDKQHNTTVSADGFRCYVVRDEIRDLPARLDPDDNAPFPDYTRIVPERGE